MEASNRRGCLLPEPVQRAALLLNIALGENRDGSHLVEDDALSVTREQIASENAPSADGHWPTACRIQTTNGFRY